MEVADSVAVRWILGTEDAQTWSPLERRREGVRVWNTQVHLTMDELLP